MGKNVEALFCRDDVNWKWGICKNSWDDAIEIVGPYKSMDVGDWNDEWNYIRVQYRDTTKNPVV